jgi:hypothetical protein
VTSKSPEALALAVLALAFGAAGAVASSASRRPEDAARSRRFQEAVGGLGLGPTVDLSRCEADFDPRVGHVCPGRHEPTPAGGAYCPHHPGSVLFE